MRSELAIWEEYGPLFSLEERLVYPPDESELEFYRMIRSRHPGTCVELGAGDGRLATTYATDDLSIGLEPSGSMCDLWNTDDRASTSVVRGLAEALPFDAATFDLVLFPYNGLHCVLQRENRLLLLREIRRILKPGGTFFIEACHRFQNRLPESEAERFDFTGSGHQLKLVETVEHHWKDGCIRFRMRYSGASVPGGNACIDLDLAMLDCSEILTDMIDSGLTVRSLWGDYDFSPWDIDNSPRILALAERT